MAISYGERLITRGIEGADVAELQLRLAGFRGTVPDGDFGPGTELQVVQFQRDVMGIHPDGIAGESTLKAIDQFACDYPIHWEQLRCSCGRCDGFGRGKYRGKYRSGKPKTEAYHQYEYPGIHRMILWAARAIFFYHTDLQFVFTSGYRCSEDNRQNGRSSTNHCGKAVDFDLLLKPGEGKRDDMYRCDMIRGSLVEKSNAQIGWGANNRKSLEPSNIAPTWVHYDVRSYASKYLKDEFFCTDTLSLDRPVY